MSQIALRLPDTWWRGCRLQKSMYRARRPPPKQTQQTQPLFYYFSKVVFFIAHPLPKVTTALLLFLQGRVFYRTSVAQDKDR